MSKEKETKNKKVTPINGKKEEAPKTDEPLVNISAPKAFLEDPAFSKAAKILIVEGDILSKRFRDRDKAIKEYILEVAPQQEQTNVK